MPNLTPTDWERLAALRHAAPREELVQASGGHELHLVGGAVRDALLGRDPRDLDLAVDGGGAEIASRLASMLPARLVRLGGERFASFRLVTRERALDLWDREGATMGDDLARRDLTLDAMALPLGDDGELVDPFGGLEDLRSRRLRATRPGAFDEDPLRILRLARLAAELEGFAADPATLALARAAAVGLSGVAPERIREELERLLGADDAAAGLAVAGEVGADWALLGKSGPAREAATDAAELDCVARRLVPLGLPTTRRDLYLARLTLLVASCGADEASRTLEHLAIARRLTRLDAREAATLHRVAGAAPAAGDLPAARRFLHAAGPLWRAALLLLVARGALAEPALGALLELERACGAELREPEPLLRGKELGRIAGIGEGRALGRLVAALRAAQIDGTVSTRAEAIAWLQAQHELPGSDQDPQSSPLRLGDV